MGVSLPMSGTKDPTSPYSLLEGHYHAVGSWYTFIEVQGEKAVMKTHTGDTHDVKIKLEDFGEADSETRDLTGHKKYNIEFTYNFGKDFSELGVVSKDGFEITTRGMMGVTKMAWVSPEDAVTIAADGDPINAPPGLYKIQPGKLGKFLWITGAPGLGKSTSAQLLCRNSGYVYYEADCFGSCKNPYIPPDVPDPSMAQVYQKALKGEGLEERKELMKRSMPVFADMMSGKDYDKELAKEFYGAMCEDIKRERKRIGGDWAIAAVTLSRDLRDIIRYKLGPDLIFVILTMDLEDVKKRCVKRHSGDESPVELLMAVNTQCEPGGEDEENAVNVVITNEMSEEDVLKKILELVN